MGAPGLVNPLLSALTVPPLALALRRFVGRRWARAGVLLCLSAPFIPIAAATLLSHTACLMALTWALYFYVRTRRSVATGVDHAAFGFAFAVAFCIRPQSTLAIGLPLVLSWALATVSLGPVRRFRAALAFLVPISVMAALFLSSVLGAERFAFLTGYARFAQYVAENQFRYTSFTADELTLTRGFQPMQALHAMSGTLAGVSRLNFNLFGWPSSLLFLWFAWPTRGGRGGVLWWMCGSYLPSDDVSTQLGHRHVRSHPRV